jgi:hypothetical protein
MTIIHTSGGQLITLEAPDEACHGVGLDDPEAPDSSYGLILLEEAEV